MKEILNEWKGFLNEQSQEKGGSPYWRAETVKRLKKHKESRPKRIEFIYELIIQSLETWNRGQFLDHMPDLDWTDKIQDAVMKAAIAIADDMEPLSSKDPQRWDPAEFDRG